MPLGPRPWRPRATALSTAPSCRPEDLPPEILEANPQGYQHRFFVLSDCHCLEPDFSPCSLLRSDGTARSWLPQPLRAVAWVSGKIGCRTVRRCPALAGVLASTDSKTDRRLLARNLSQGVCTASLRANSSSERQVKKDYPPPILGRQEAVKHVPDFLLPSARSPQRKRMVQGTSTNSH